VSGLEGDTDLSPEIGIAYWRWDSRDEDGAGHPSGSFKKGFLLNVTFVAVLTVSNSRGALRRVWMMISGWQNSRMGKRDVPTPREVYPRMDSCCQGPAL